jgi:hypothetical protein
MLTIYKREIDMLYGWFIIDEIYDVLNVGIQIDQIAHLIQGGITMVSPNVIAIIYYDLLI